MSAPSSIREKALGPNHPDTATSLNNLAELGARPMTPATHQNLLPHLPLHQHHGIFAERRENSKSGHFRDRQG